MLRKLLFLSFIEGAAVMAAELCGAKLLAPVFGSSLYVWASVMGITLFALAAGYFYGGLVSEKSKDHSKKLFQILIAAALFLLLMPVIAHYLVPRISYVSFLPAVVISTLSLLFFPVFFLGASSPLFIVLQTNSTNSSGKVSGTVYAISTFGGIFATFLCGFYLIPVIGLSYTLLIFGCTLFIFTLLTFKIIKGAQLLLFAGFIYLNLQFTLRKSNSLMDSDSILGHLEVSDVNAKPTGVRLLKINSIVQTEMDLRTKHSVSGYVSLLDTLVNYSQTQKKALILGLGGGLTANLFIEKNYKVTGVEFDERIIEASKNFFSLDPEVETFCEDARYFLNHSNTKYDLILFDVFKAEEQPAHVITMESLAALKKNLYSGGVVYVNWHGYTTEEYGKGTAVLVNTFARSGFHVNLASLSTNENYRNIILVCTLEDNKEIIPYDIKDKLSRVELVNTDGKPVLEKYNASANKIWRSNYLRYYQTEKTGL